MYLRAVFAAFVITRSTKKQPGDPPGPIVGRRAAPERKGRNVGPN
jgi:hypothetical protein